MKNKMSFSACIFSIIASCTNTTSIPEIVEQPIPWNDSIKYDSIIDERDGRIYKITTIGTQTWMAENLQYSGIGGNVGYCSFNLIENCNKYGRMYSWATAKGIDTIFNKSLYQKSGTTQGICPAGYSLPRNSDWEILFTYIENSNGIGKGNAGQAIKAKSAWVNQANATTDPFGFRAIPGGIGSKSSTHESYQVGTYELWANANELNDSISYNTHISKFTNDYDLFTTDKSSLVHVRCIKNSTIPQ